jgi:hypothetical protein
LKVKLKGEEIYGNEPFALSPDWKRMATRKRKGFDEFEPHVRIWDLENRKLVKHLINERDALFTFLRDPNVPASNWWGEQAVRPAVVTRKIWGGNRTHHGAATQQILVSVFRTCAQQRVDPYAVIEELLRSSGPRLASLPSFASGP